MRRILLAGGTALVVVTALAACSPGGGSGSTSGRAGGASLADPEVNRAPSPAPTAAGGDSATSTAATVGRAAGRGPTTTGSTAGSTAPSTALDAGVRIRRADLGVTVRRAQDVASRADAAERIAVRAGGVVDADERASGRDADATLTLRVPPAALLAVLHSLSGLGTERTRHLSTEDVTQKVADIRSRVTSAQQAITRLRTLYARSQKVSDVIAIEGELSGREADLESLQAQSRALDHQTALATVTLYLSTDGPATAPAKKSHGFLGGLSRGWDGFTAAAAAVAVAIGAAVPFLAVALLVAFAARLAWRRRGHHATAAPPPAE